VGEVLRLWRISVNLPQPPFPLLEVVSLKRPHCATLIVKFLVALLQNRHIRLYLAAQRVTLQCFCSCTISAVVGIEKCSNVSIS
jgi:hypothetical protein